MTSRKPPKQSLAVKLKPLFKTALSWTIAHFSLA